MIELVEETAVADYRHDHLPALTMGLYEAFMAKGEAGLDALLAWLHLLYTYPRQSTNQAWATHSHLWRGLRKGRNKATARALLRKMGLTEAIPARDGKRKDHRSLDDVESPSEPWPESHTTMGPATPENHRVAEPRGGDRREMLGEGVSSHKPPWDCRT